MTAIAPPDYEFVLYDSVNLNAMDTLPLTNVKWQNGLNGIGSITADLSTESSKCTLTNIQTLTREIAVWRNNVPVMMGPIIGMTPNLAQKTISITCATPWWWMSKRAVEAPVTYATAADVGASVWAMINAAQSLAPNGSAHISQSPSYPGSTYGFPTAYVLTGLENDPVSTLIENIGLQYPGFDFDISYASAVGNMSVSRYFNVYSPFKTANADRPLTENELSDFTIPENGADAMTRARDFAQVTDAAGTSGTLVSSVNDSRLTATTLPMVTTMTTRDAPDQATLDTWANGDLFIHKWPMRVFTATYQPSVGVPFGAYNLGDLVTLNVNFPYFSITTQQRMVAYSVTWSGDTGAGEEIELIFNNPVATAP